MTSREPTHPLTGKLVYAAHAIRHGSNQSGLSRLFTRLRYLYPGGYGNANGIGPREVLRSRLALPIR